MPPEVVLLKGKGENRYIFAKAQDYNKGRRRKDEKEHWAQYEVVERLELSELLSAALTSGKFGYTIEALAELTRGCDSSIQKLKTPVNREIDRLYKGVKHSKPPQHL